MQAILLGYITYCIQIRLAILKRCICPLVRTTRFAVSRFMTLTEGHVEGLLNLALFLYQLHDAILLCKWFIIPSHSDILRFVTSSIQLSHITIDISKTVIHHCFL